MKRNEKKKVVLCRIYPEYEDCGAVMCAAAHSLGARYLKAYCEADEELRARYEISIMEFPVSAGARRIGKAVEAEGPEVVGFSVYVNEYPEALEAAAGLKKRRPGMLSVFGGLRVLDSVAEMKRYEQIDVFVEDEGEIPFAEILSRFAGGGDFSGVPGTAWRTGGGIVRNPDRGELAEPSDIPDIFTKDYVAALEGAVRFPTARGCRKSCSFCPEACASYREYPMDRVLRGLDLLLRNPRIRLIVFDDPDFGQNKKRFSEILDFTIERNADGKALAGCWSSWNAGRPLLDKMKRAGFTPGIDVSLQSGNPDTLATVKRKWMTLGRLSKIAPDILEVFPEARAEVILGLPLETRKTFIDTLAELRRMGFSSVRSHRLRVYPATELHGNAEKSGVRFQPGGHYLVESTKTLTPEDILFAETAVFRYNVLARLLPPEFEAAWETLGISFPELLRGNADYEACIRKGRRWPDDVLNTGDLKKNAPNILCERLRAAGVPQDSLETIRELSRIGLAMKKHVLRISDMLSDEKCGAARPLHGYEEIRTPAAVLPFLGLRTDESAGKTGRRSVFMLFNYETEKVVPVSSLKPGAFRELLDGLECAESLDAYLKSLPEDEKESTETSILTLVDACLVRR